MFRFHPDSRNNVDSNSICCCYFYSHRHSFSDHTTYADANADANAATNGDADAYGDAVTYGDADADNSKPGSLRREISL